MTLPELRAEFDDRGLLFTFDLETISLIDFWRDISAYIEESFLMAPKNDRTLFEVRSIVTNRIKAAIQSGEIYTDFDGEWKHKSRYDDPRICYRNPNIQ